MLFRLYCSSDNKLRTCPANEGFYVAIYLLWLLKGRGINTEVINTKALPEEDLKQTYTDAVIAAAAYKLSIRRTFGTHRRSAIYFGRKVPALLVYNDDNRPIFVCPYQATEGGSEVKFPVSIATYLQDLLDQNPERLEFNYRKRQKELMERRASRRLTR